jgi:tRNA-splicing ligase RtcB (3'-phosphate/5'-hydroxy nucleic acid ligase)
MKKTTVTGKELRALGYPQTPVIPVAMNIVEKQFAFEPKDTVIALLVKLLANPEAYLNDDRLSPIAQRLAPVPEKETKVIALNAEPVALNVFGANYIEQGAFAQMDNASRLPVAVSAALMPDAHAGYGLPIGGVLATDNAVIPYGVGVDIGCRMCLSIFDIDPRDLLQKEAYFARELNEATIFGAGGQFNIQEDAEVLNSPLFREIALLRPLQSKAAKQLGTSGSGNHFVEFGIVEVNEQDDVLNVAPGKYLGLLSHSGSRALGATIANHYTKIAKELRQLPGEASNLAWLDLNEEAGMEYWLAMNLAGDYASACHHSIHAKISVQLGRAPQRMVENHHNFAWKEMIDGKERIVHRKGATPAGRNVLGIIPGSMTAPGFIVKGKGELASLSSASHGAGRRMSRSAALKSITQDRLNDLLKVHGVKLIGGGLDEAPEAYKNIEEVMAAQKQLVDVVGKFTPKIVKMDGTAPKQWRKKRGDEVVGE